MRRTRVGAAAVAALLVVMVAVPGSAGADSRIPVSSVDDATSPVANRIAAVTNIISATGIANQLASIATVLGNADDRLGGIRVPDPGPPESPEAAALNALSVVVSEGGNAAGGWLGASFDYPPYPCAVDG